MHRVLLLPLSFPSLATCLRNLWPFTVGRTDRLKPSAPCLRASDHSTRPAAKPRGNCMDYWFQSGCGAAPRLRTIGCALRGPQGRRWRSWSVQKWTWQGAAAYRQFSRRMRVARRWRTSWRPRRGRSGARSAGGQAKAPASTAQGQCHKPEGRRAGRAERVSARFRLLRAERCRSAPRYPDRHVG